MNARAWMRRPGTVATAAMLAAATLALVGMTSLALAADTTFVSPVAGQRVYDTAAVFQEWMIGSAERTIAGIEQRTGAQVVVYTRDVGTGVTTDEAKAEAASLMDQWGVGRKGFDDGLVILFDIDPSGCHGQVELYAGAGFRSTFMSDADRQHVFDEQMLPLLEQCRLGEAMLAGLAAIDASATPEHAAALERSRQVDAVVGLVLAPIVFLLLSFWALWSWLRHGRDPVYLDDPSIHLPAPPPDLTPATGALVFEGRTSQRAFTTALMDLASRGQLAFDQLEHADKGKIAIDFAVPAPPDAEASWRRRRAERQPIGPGETYLADALRRISRDRIEPDRMPEVAGLRGPFQEKLETQAVAKGWFGRRPGSVMRRWFALAAVEATIGVILAVIGWNVPFAGLLMLGVAVLLGAGVTAYFAWSMPARTLPGAMIRAMLAAYRRTLDKTMAQARSMGQVVEEAAVPLIEDPDAAVVWAVALGLAHRVDEVMARSLEDVRRGSVHGSALYLPVWYRPAPAGGGSSGGWFGGGGSAFSSSAIPNIGGMMAVIGTIGAPASSSGGGGGFGGGFSGGGGGAGGGF